MARRLADRYVLGNRVGVGGTSRVHAALDERLGRQVAVKLLDADVVGAADPAGRERFVREGRTMARFSHRHAVTVFDAGEDAGDLFIVMELVDGPSLAEHLALEGPLPVDETVRIAGQLLSALAAAHAAGIVHRDVKPANVLIGPGGDTKLADFGIAKRFDDLEASVTSTGMVVGTPRYLAPEQAIGLDATPATDVYSMGVVMFEMLTGHLPFEADSFVATAMAQQSRDAPDVRSLQPGVPAELATVVARALKTQPAERPQTAAAFVEALEAASSRRPLAQVVPTQVLTPAMHPPTERWAHTDVSTSTPTTTQPPSPPSPPSSNGRTAVLLFAVLVVILGGVVAAATIGSDDPGDVVDDAVSTSAAGLGSTEPSAAAPTVTQPAVTEPPATEALVPEPTATTLPVAEPPAEELVPGFAATDDLAVFLAQIERDPALLGESGEELADDLRKVLEERGAKQREEAEHLREVLVEFVEDGEIPPAIADALDELLEPLVERG